MADSISTWEVISAIGLPVLGGAYGLLWAHVRTVAADLRTDIAALWSHVNLTTRNLAEHKVDCERRYARADDVKDLKDELMKRLDRFEQKLDRALPHSGEGEEPMHAIDYTALEREIIAVEGLKLTLYRCTAGKLSIGIGRNLEDRGISEDEARLMLRNDIAIIERELDRAIPWWRTLSDGRQRALINMAMMGVPRLLQFKRMFGALEAGDWAGAAAEALNSKWARDVQPSRVEMVRKLLVEG